MEAVTHAAQGLPALRRVCRHPPGEARHAVNVNGGERLVEHPQRGAGQPQAGQRHPALLPGRELSDRHVLKSRQPGLRQRLRETRAVAGVEEVQVLPRRQAGFDPRLVPYPQQAAMEAVTHAAQGLALPVHLPAVRARQPGQQAQQGGFSRAVAAGDLHPLPGVHGERQPAKQRPLVPLAVQISGFKHHCHCAYSG